PVDEVDRPDRGVVVPPRCTNLVFKDLPSGLDAIKYNPYRDVAYTHRSIITAAIARLHSTERWPAMNWLLNTHRRPWWRRVLEHLGYAKKTHPHKFGDYETGVVCRI